MQQAENDIRCQENRGDTQKPNCVVFFSEMLWNGQILIHWQM